MAEVSFTPEQQSAVCLEGGNLLVAAAAGSGKTHVLVSRLMRHVCEEGRDIDKFLVITYTRAAAAELRARILAEIGKRLKVMPSRHLLRQQTLIHRAKINTIHAFCQSVLRENAHLLGISPDFRVADEGETQVLLGDTLEKVLSGRYDQLESSSAFRTLADTMGAGRDDSALCEIVLQTRAALLSHPYPEKWSERCVSQWELAGVSDAKDTVWGAYILRTEKAAVQYWIEQMRDTLETVNSNPAMAKAYAESFEESILALRAYSKALDKGWDDAAEKSAVAFPRLGSLRNFEDKALSESVKDVRERCKKAMGKSAERLCAKTEELLDDMRALSPVIRELFSLVSDLEAALTQEKRRRNILDFSDLEHLTLKLLRDAESGKPTETAKLVQGRFAEIMVDEYQDVNEVQDMIFSAVSNGRNLFMVGDVKQSIYRFRLANPGIFLEKYRKYKDEGAKGEGRRVLLSQNFRSRKGVLDAVNFVFENIMSEKFGEMEYTDREALHSAAQFPESAEPCMELMVLDASESEDESRTALEARLAAKRIDELLRSGMTVSDKTGERPLRCSDIMLLLRSLKGRAEIYTSALAERGIAAQTDKKAGFFESLEITVMLSLLSVIDDPHQDVQLISALRSPLFGFSADELALIRAADTSADMYDALKKRAEANERCRDFCDRLAKYRLISADMAADELIWRIYLDTGALAIFGAMPQGDSREANLMQLCDYAGSFKSTGNVGLFGFLRYIRKLMERGKEPEIAQSAKSADAVTITSIHKSKGLEAPVVLLCDTAKLFNAEDTRKPLLIHSELGAGPWRTDLKRRIKYPTMARMAVADKLREEMLAEELRVLYVAMTRAKERLIVTCSYKNAPREIARFCKTAALPASPQALKDCRSMADWLLTAALCRQEAAALRDAAETELRTYPTVERWNITLCGLSDLSAPDKREADAEKAPAEGCDAELAAIKEKLSFEYPHAGAPLIPSKLTATELKSNAIFEREAAEEAQPIAETVKRNILFRVPDFAPKRALTAAEKGTAAHLAMQYIDYSRCGSEMEIRGEISRMERQRLLTPEQAESVNAGWILRLFKSPLGKRILAADAIVREFKFSILRDAIEYYPDGAGESVLLQGVVDCCIEEAGELTVIDYKTDYVGDEGAQAHAEQYRAQLEAYAAAMEEITGKKVRERTVFFLRTGESAAICAKF